MNRIGRRIIRFMLLIAGARNYLECH